MPLPSARTFAGAMCIDALRMAQSINARGVGLGGGGATRPSQGDS